MTVEQKIKEKEQMIDKIRNEILELKRSVTCNIDIEKWYKSRKHGKFFCKPVKFYDDSIVVVSVDMGGGDLSYLDTYDSYSTAHLKEYDLEEVSYEEIVEEMTKHNVEVLNKYK